MIEEGHGQMSGSSPGPLGPAEEGDAFASRPTAPTPRRASLSCRLLHAHPVPALVSEGVSEGGGFTDGKTETSTG